VTNCIASTGGAAAAGKALEQQRFARVGDGPAVAQHRGQGLGIAEAQIDALPSQRMDAVRGVADERHAMGDRRAQPRELKREAGRRRDRFERAEGVAAARGNPRRQRVRRQLEKLARKRLGGGPDHATRGARAAGARRARRRRRETTAGRVPGARARN
jgi:hypothetical protein